MTELASSTHPRKLRMGCVSACATSCVAWICSDCARFGCPARQKQHWQMPLECCWHWHQVLQASPQEQRTMLIGRQEKRARSHSWRLPKLTRKAEQRVLGAMVVPAELAKEALVWTASSPLTEPLPARPTHCHGWVRVEPWVAQVAEVLHPAQLVLSSESSRAWC